GQAGLGRIDREVRVTEQALVGPGIAEGDAAGEGLAALDVEPDLIAWHHGPPVRKVFDRRRGNHGATAGARPGGTAAAPRISACAPTQTDVYRKRGACTMTDNAETIPKRGYHAHI